MGLPTVNILKRIGLALTLALIPLAAFGQSQTVRQSGTVTRNHSVIWNSNGVVQDGGTAADSNLNTLGIVSNQPASFCVNSDHASAAGRQQLCMGVTTNGPGVISIQNFGTAPASTLQFSINGTPAVFTTTVNPVSGAVVCFSALLQLTTCPNTTGTGNIVYDNSPTINSPNLVNALISSLVSPLATLYGGTGANSPAGARTNLGLGSMAIQSASNVSITGGSISGLASPLAVTDGGSGANNASGARTNFGLGTMATQNASGVAISGGAITGIPSPTNPSDVAIKSYVDSIASGFTPLQASRLATTIALAANTYANGALGVGATLTASGNGALSIDSVAVNVSDRVLIKNEATASHNGIYTVTATGDAGNPYVLTRATDFDTAAEMKAGSQTFISAGTVNSNSTYALLNNVATVGTDPVTFVQTAQFSIGPNSVALSNLAQIGSNTTLCNPTGITANVAACSQAQLTALVANVTSSLAGDVPSPGATGNKWFNANGGSISWQTMTLGAIALTDTNIVVGNGSNVAAGVAMSGDCTMADTGAITCNIPLNHLPSQANNTVLGNVSGISASPIAITATQLTTLCNLVTTSLTGCVPARTGNVNDVLRGNNTWGSVVSGCPPAVFCVSVSGSLAAAVTAASGAGGGTVWVDVTQNLAAAQTVGANIKILCASGVFINTTSATADILTLSGTNTSVEDCGFSFTGAGPKTAGYFINMTNTATIVYVNNVTMSDTGHGGCFVCIHADGIINYVTNVTINANTAAVSASSGCMVEDVGSQILAIANFTCGSGPTHPYAFGIKQIAGAISATNMELLQETIPILIAPSAGVATFMKVAASYLDNCGSYCLRVQPSANTGTVGTVDFQGTEFGTASSTFQAVELDTSTNGGNIGETHINGGNIFSYVANANQAILVVGTTPSNTLGSLTISNVEIGSNYNVGIFIFNNTQVKTNFNNNEFLASSTCIISSTVLSAAPIWIGNRCNGTTVNAGGSSTTNIQFNP